MGNRRPFAVLLREARRAAGLTQEDLAARSGLSIRSIGDMECGRTRSPYARSVELLANALGVPEPLRAELLEAARRQPPAAPRQLPAAPVQLPVVPRQLPAAAGGFTGRSAELTMLTALSERDGSPGTVVVSAIGGTAGVGKTALAVHWAHQAAGRFPDGQLYVNLRGYDPDQPMAPADALAAFLRALGVPGQDIPDGTGERAARYRGLLAGRRMLVLLDNARDVEQVRPLLPGTPACVTVVTSRSSLAGLVARDGARRLDLDLMPLADAAELLRTLIGERAVADPAATLALAQQCSRLPLALRVAAELAVRTSAPLAGLAAELADQQRRLDLLDADGDPRTAVRAVFSRSYQQLGRDTARAFRLAGLHPGPDLDRYAAGALTGMTAEQAEGELGQLLRAHLIQATGPGRYGLHDLLRAYALELCTAEDGKDELRAALTRLFDYYLENSAAAMDALYPSERHRRPSVRRPSARRSSAGGPAAPGPQVTSPDQALAWLDAQRSSLVAVAEYTVAHGWPEYTSRLAATVFRYLDTSGHYPETVTVVNCARRAARDTGNQAAEADVLDNLAVIDVRHGRYPQAIGHLEQALALCRETGDRAVQASALGNLGIVAVRQGHYEQAASYYRQALAVCRETGDQVLEAFNLARLGVVDLRLGRYGQAAGYYRRALTLARETGDRALEASVLTGLGVLDARQGQYRQATEHHLQALALCRETGDRTREAEVLTCLADLALRQAHHLLAAGRYREALALCRDTGDRTREARALNGLGDVLLATGHPGLARTEHTAALSLASQIGNTYDQARAHDGLGRAGHALGDLAQARHHWQEACTLYTRLGSPEADQVRALLASQAPSRSSQQARRAL